MKYEYKKDSFITYTEVNSKLQLNLVSVAQLLQNMMTEYYSTFEQDNFTTKNKYNAVWVLVKTKIKFNKLPIWRETIKEEAYTTKVTPIRTESESIFKNQNDEILFSAKQESCAIDIETRKIRKLNTLNYPNNMEIREALIQDNFYKLNSEFKEEDKVYEQKVQTADIDYSKHTNNVMYVRYIVNAMKCEFWENVKVKEFEIHYICETRENDNLEVFKKMEENEVNFLIKHGNKEVARAKICFE